MLYKKEELIFLLIWFAFTGLVVRSFSMNATVASLLGAIIGASTGLLSALISNLLLFHQQRDLWNKQQESERQKQIRAELYEIYRNCIYHLSVLSRGQEFIWWPTLSRHQIGS